MFRPMPTDAFTKIMKFLVAKGLSARFIAVAKVNFVHGHAAVSGNITGVVSGYVT